MNDYGGPERRSGELVVLGNKVDNLTTLVMETSRRFETALFARDSDNEFGVPGAVTFLQKADRHIDTVCKWARWMKYAAAGVITGMTSLAGLVAAGNAAGWW